MTRSRELAFGLNEAMAIGSLGGVEYREGNVDRGLELMEQSVEIAQSAGFKWWEAQMHASLAMYAVELGRLDEAEKCGRRVLALARQMGDRRLIVESFALLARKAIDRGDAYRAGLLWGAVEAEEQRGPMGQSGRIGHWSVQRAEFAAVVLADPTPDLERGLADGRRFSLDDAVECALHSLD